MAQARVQLRHCESYTGLSGLAWTKNQSRVLTDEKQIAYYRTHTEFVVTVLQEPKRPKSAKSAATSGDDGGGGDDSGSAKLSKAKLERMSKTELVDYAAETFQLALDEDEMKKDDLVVAVLEAQG